MESKSIELREKLIKSGEKAVEELIKVAEESIIKPILDEEDSELAADKLKNAAASKKLAIFDAFEILERIERERENLKELKNKDGESTGIGGFAEGRARAVSRST